MPPLAPPKGIPISAHFHVIHIARDLTSSSSTSGWYRMPPLDGPRAMLCVTRYPSKTLMSPSSIVTGTETTTAFLHSWRTLTRLGSTANNSATRRSCSFAMSYGFSRRCDSGTSSVVTSGASLFDREGEFSLSRPAAVRRHRGEGQRVVARRQRVPVRITAGQAERIGAGKQVAQPDQQPELGAVRARQHHVEPAD